ncbi:MAG: D-alanine--D-alanine ligase [Acidobacteriota bacterium]
MDRKIRVGVLFGGKSAEHEVSLQSAANIVRAMDPEKYDTVLIGIDKRGRWCLNEASQSLLEGENLKLPALSSENQPVTLVPWARSRQLFPLSDPGSARPVDVIFPVLHGPLGEDGTVQGLLRLAGIPFVGSGVLASAVSMDKDVAKRLLRDAGIPIARFLVWEDGCRDQIHFQDVEKALGRPFFVKPANLGSSVGIHKVRLERELGPALDDAFHYDHKVLLEQNIEGRELECSVLGNQHPVASLPGEVITRHDFYSYEAKYVDEEGAELEIPAQLPDSTGREVQRLAVEAFQVLGCRGMARVDFFLTNDCHLLVNEVNTIPGFTRISMYPKLWEASGVTYSDLIDRLIQLALESGEREKQLIDTYEP